MAQQHYEPAEVGRLAEGIYNERLRASVETEENIGKIIVIDVETGDFEIDEDGLVAGRRIRAKHPDLNPRALFAIRIGYNAVFTIGGAITRTTTERRPLLGTLLMDGCDLHIRFADQGAVTLQRF